MDMTRAERAEAVALAHFLPIPLRQEAREGRARNILVRFDAMERNDEPVVFAVIGVGDLAKLPEDTLQGLKMLTIGDDGRLRGNPDAFFMRGPNGVSLYVNTDNDGGVVDRIYDIALEEDMVVEVADGDLRLLSDPDGEIVAPASPAFGAFDHVPVRKAIEMIHDLRLGSNDPDFDPEAEHDDPDPLSPC